MGLTSLFKRPKVNKKNTLFICPLNDAEAVSIYKMLVAYGWNVITTAQSWGASWNKLEPEVKRLIDHFAGYVYGIELQGKKEMGIAARIGVAPPEHYNIDHHKYASEDRTNSLASIEQVADLIGVDLDYYQKAIALNDTGHIRLMRQNSIPEHIIQKVRALDRKAQGITEEHEHLGEIALRDKLSIIGDLTLVYLQHSKCAVITDRLDGQYKELLILCADGESDFYGTGSICQQLYNKFKGWTSSDLTYRGFWGGYPDQDELLSYCLTLIKQ